mmetsp:Transcript_32553/g.28820  ORF Transcript_32553/g.28820 Transcript_32553/m.28820 type:complete len:109 (-) Transcript_32553:111-437(-)
MRKEMENYKQKANTQKERNELLVQRLNIQTDLLNQSIKDTQNLKDQLMISTIIHSQNKDNDKDKEKIKDNKDKINDKKDNKDEVVKIEEGKNGRKWRKKKNNRSSKPL